MIVAIETDRLIMRPFVADDLAEQTKLHAEESFWWFPLRRGMTPEETAVFVDRVVDAYASPGSPSLHALVERSSGSLISWAGLSVPDFLPEVLPAIEVGLDEIISIFEPENVASGKVMDRLGFGPAGERRSGDAGLATLGRVEPSADGPGTVWQWSEQARPEGHTASERWPSPTIGSDRVRPIRPWRGSCDRRAGPRSMSAQAPEYSPAG